jgi:CRP/FNR family transcriptional regulator, cyclic AMP receptor protein
VALSGSFSVARQLAARFTGSGGSHAICEMICKVPFVEGNSEVANQLAAVATIVPYEAGEVLITQGAADTGIYFILSGSVSVARSGRGDIVRCAPTHVGEMATIDPSARRSATIKAREPTVVARVAEPNFSRIANAYPFVWRHLAIELGDRLRQRLANVPVRNEKARVFIASSSEGLKIATTLKAAFATDPFDVNVWTDGIFTPGLTNIEVLEEELERADFAVLLLTSDDRVLSRWVFSRAPRDNLILELGLFVGAIGRRRAIMVQPAGSKLKIPTDLLGVIPIKYAGTDMNFVAAELQKIFHSLGSK